MNNQTGRVMEILQQIKNDSFEIIRSDQVKVGLSLLGVLSRDVSNRMVIVNHGIDIVVTVMNIYINKVEIIGTGCNLLWILAFDCATGVENIIKNDGILLIIKCLQLHHKAENVTKTACAVISNAFFISNCQHDFYVHGGVQPLITALHSQYAQSNYKVLPFIFDAIGTIALNNTEISKAFSILGLIPFILTVIKSIAMNAVVKSGTQLLSILSTIDGLTTNILVNDGLRIIVSVIESTPISIDIHRVASIVLLRLLEQNTITCREFSEFQGTRIILSIIFTETFHVDTLVAFMHVLLKSSRLNTIGISWSQLEGQLWGPNENQKPIESNHILPIHVVKSKGSNTSTRSRGYLQGLLNAFSTHCNRKDISRPACRYFASIISNGTDVAEALFELGILDKIFRCVHIHSEVKDIIDSAAVILLQLQRKYLQSQKRSFNSYFTLKHDNCHDVIYGIILIYQCKCGDDELALACIKLLLESVRLVTVLNPLRHGNANDHNIIYKERLKLAFDMSLAILQRAVNNNIDNKSSAASDSSYKRPTTSNVMTRNSSINNANNPGNFGYRNNSAKDSSATLDDCNLGIRAKSYSNRSMTIYGNDSNFTRQYEALVEEQFAVERAKRLAFYHHICSSILALLYEITTLVLTNIPVDVGSESTDKLRSTLQLMIHYQQLDDPVLTERIDKIVELFSLTLDSGGSSEKNSSGSPLKRTVNPKPKKRVTETKFIEASPSFEEKFLTKEVTTVPSDINSDDQSKCSDPAPVSDVIDSCNSGLKIKVVYENYQSNNNKSINSSYRQIPPYSTDVQPHQFKHSITFSSEFESGNLLRAIQRDDYSYDLLLRNDYNTPEQLTQWYYFAVTNIFSPKDIQRFTDQGVDSVPLKIQFQIINFYKPDSLYNSGMQPVIYSCFDAAKNGQGWVRAGTNISYHNNTYPQKYNGTNKEMSNGNYLYQYSLRFTVEFKNVNDTVYIAHSYPYTYDDHKLHINNLLKKPNINDVMSISTLCKTVNGEDCDLLVITDFKNAKDIGPITISDTKEESMASALKKSSTNGHTTKYKPGLFFSARVHPGESPASWMMKGFIDYLLSDQKDAIFLRSTYVIFIIPMLNPDGVILGNYRCNLAGVDLNRQWKYPSKTLHPTIFHMKSLMVAQNKLRNITMFVDFHGHSAKHNAFLYGYDDKKEKKSRPHVRQFPSFFSSHIVGSKYVNVEDCSYNIMRGHENTARVVCATDLNIHYTYTLETTFSGCNFGPLQGIHYNMHHLMEIGASLAEATSQFLADKYEKIMPVSDTESLDIHDATDVECASPSFRISNDTSSISTKGIRAQPSSKVITGIRVTRNTLGDGTLLKSPSNDLKIDMGQIAQTTPTGHIKSNDKCFSLASDALETLILSKQPPSTEDASPARSKRRNKKGGKNNSRNYSNELQVTPTKSKLASIMMLSPINSSL